MLQSVYKKLFAVPDVNSLLWKRDFAALQVVYNIVVCRFFIIIAHSVVDTSCHIALTVSVSRPMMQSLHPEGPE